MKAPFGPVPSGPSFRGKGVLVTGASRGIGEAIALAFAAAGARVAVNSRGVSGAPVAKACGGIHVRGDVGRSGERIVAEAARRLGRLDVLVNNAGVSDPKAWTADLDAVDRRLWDRVMDADLRGAFLCSRAAAKVMGEGAILNVSSIPALTGEREGIIYSIAKAGVLGLTKSLAVLLAPRIRVNAMAFGSIGTGWTGWLTPALRKDYERAIPVGRFGRPEEAAQLAIFLAGNAYITGQTYVLDGGEARV